MAPVGGTQRLTMRWRVWVPCGLAALAAGCVRPPPAQDALQPVAFAKVPGWQADTLAQTLPALRAGCRRLAQLPVDTDVGGAGLAAQAGGKAGQWAQPCLAANALTPGDEPSARRFYETWFQPYRINAPALFTGYYEPEVRGALSQGGAYQTPLLARPADLVQSPSLSDDPHGPPVVGRLQSGRLVPYWTRAEIVAGRIGPAARPLFWLADPIDLFFLQLQGAGRIRMPDGAVVRVAYDGKNGRPYTPIGRVLVAQHALAPEAVTMQSIRAWLTAHPAQAPGVMNANEDYVFFRALTGDDTGMGPPGALGVKLSAGRSAAVDRHSIPLGAPIFADTLDPLSGKPWQRLLLAQDTGSDITGAARTDIFFGAGDLAEQEAGRLHAAGTEFVLLPRVASHP